MFPNSIGAMARPHPAYETLLIERAITLYRVHYESLSMRFAERRHGRDGRQGYGGAGRRTTISRSGKGVSEMAERIRGIRSISLEGFKAIVTNGKITKFQIDAKISVGEDDD